MNLKCTLDCRVVWCVVGHCDSSECGLIRDLDCWDIEISDYRGSAVDTVSDVHTSQCSILFYIVCIIAATYITNCTLPYVYSAVVAVVSPTAAINYSLVDNPTFTDSYIETRHKVCVPSSLPAAT